MALSGGRPPELYESSGARPRQITSDGSRWFAPFRREPERVSAFTRRGSDGRRIGIIKPDGTGEKALTNGPADEGASWAASSRELIFDRVEATGASGLFRISLDGSEPRDFVIPQGGSDPDWSGVMD